MPSATVHGRVTDRVTGIGIADARVAIVVMSDGDAPSGITETTTHERGGYTAVVSWSGTASLLAVSALAKGYALEILGRAPSEGDHAVDLSLVEGFSVDLFVVDEAGVPVAGAEVRAILNDEKLGTCAWPLSLPWSGRPAKYLTDAGGRAELDGLKAHLADGERYVLAVAHPAHVEALVDRPEQMDRSGAVLSLPVSLEHGHRLAGTVVVPAGEEARLASVSAFFQDGSGAQPACHAIVKEANVDDEGQFLLVGLATGKHWLVVTHPGLLEARRSIEAPMPALSPIALSAGRRIEGVVKGGNGAFVTFQWDTGRRELSADANGRFVASGLPTDAKISMVVAKRSESGDDFVGARLFEAGGSTETSSVDAHDRAEIRVRTRNRQTGMPLALGVMIDGHELSTRARFRVHCDTPDGELAMRLPPGSYDLGIRASEAWELRYAGLVHLEVRRGEPVDLVAPLAAAFDLDVIVRTEEGAPVCDAAVEVVSRHLWSCHFSARTDGEGRAKLASMIPDAAELRVLAGGYARLVRTVDFAEERGPLCITVTPL